MTIVCILIWYDETMTVTYTDQVATASFGCFLRLLFIWRGSIYKLIWKELLIYLLVYFILSFTYRFGLTEVQKRDFELAVSYCSDYNAAIALSFVLGFYVQIVLDRWKSQFVCIPWPDSTAMFLIAYLHNHDARSRLMRRTIMRYVNLSYVMTMRSISPPVKKRFPTLDHLTWAGLMLPKEQKIMEGIHTPYNKYPIPIIWATAILSRARKENRINDLAVAQINACLSDFRFNLGRLFLMDSVSVPILYTQVFYRPTNTKLQFHKLLLIQITAMYGHNVLQRN